MQDKDVLIAEPEELQYEEYDMITIKNNVLYPHTQSHFDMSRENNKIVIKKVAETNENFVIATISDDIIPKMNDIAVIATISNDIKSRDGKIGIDVTGIARVKIVEFISKDPYYRVKVKRIIEDNFDTRIADIYMSKIKSMLQVSKFGQRVATKLPMDKPSNFCDYIMSELAKDFDKKLKALNLINVEERLDYVLNFVVDETKYSKINELIDKDIEKRLKENMDKSQREYILRERIKAINDELGTDTNEMDIIEEKIKKLNVSEEIREKLLKDLNTLKRTPTQSPDSTTMRKYLDTVLELPWGKYTEDNFDIANARKILDEDHSGMEKIKQRIVEYIACMKLTGKVNGQILCFVGPPGVGKTSIAKSIARALGRNYVRMSLGGIKDESEIRGHRKTYVAAMPGRIIYNMRLAKVDNPLFLIDEIDKLGSDYKGDPSSAMLEVLDPEQNFSFRDNYLEVPYDLSKVLFIATANDMSTIPGPLRDRMEIIELSGYTTNEKVNIAKEHLISKQLEKHGLTSEQVEIKDETIYKIIESYTFEAGVRSLERNIANICRKSALKILEGEKDNIKRVIVLPEDLKEYLGVPKNNMEKRRQEDEVGVVSGLYYTPYGGGILNIEVSTNAGKGNVQITGQLGDVMKESAQIAISILKNYSSKYGIDLESIKNSDIHIHIPEGAVKKDGPSAGIALTTALISQFSNKKVNSDLAMTGEIGLRGEVLPIGGLKEKLFACVRSGIKNAIVPDKNRDDVEDLPKDITDNLNISYVSNIQQVLDIALR